MTWCAIQIYISLISSPYVGSTICTERYKFGVAICRAIAAIGEDKANNLSYKAWANLVSGFAFAGSFTNSR
jgi:hypothetical protein